MNKTTIGINTLTAVDQFVYLNHFEWAFNLGRFCEDKFLFCQPRRMSIDHMRNMAAKLTLEQEADALMFVDDDVIIPLDTYQKLRDSEYDIIAGVTYIRSFPFMPMVFEFAGRFPNFFYEDFREKQNKDTHITDCDAVGFSCCYIKSWLLKELPPPYFVTGINHTEDIYFCQKAKKYFPEVKIGVHCDVHTSHALGTEYISEENRPFWQEYIKKNFPEHIESMDRQQEYLDQNGINLEDIESRMRNK